MKKIMMDLIHVKNVYKNVSNYQKVKRKKCSKVILKNIVQSVKNL